MNKYMSSSSDGEKTLFLVQDGNLRALVTGRSLFRLPLSGTTFLLTSDTAVLSQFKTSLKIFLYNSGYSVTLTFSQALHAVLDFMLILLLTSSLVD